MLVDGAAGREAAFHREPNRGVTWNAVISTHDQPNAGHDGFCFARTIELAEKIDLDFDALSNSITVVCAQQSACYTQIHDLSE